MKNWGKSKTNTKQSKAPLVFPSGAEQVTSWVSLCPQLCTAQGNWFLPTFTPFSLSPQHDLRDTSQVHPELCPDLRSRP